SLFVAGTAREVDTLGRRLLTAQVVAVACFIAFPLRLAFVRPETSGFSGFLFDRLTAFDKPFNQAPSLHIALLVILWVHYLRPVPRAWAWALPGLAGLIGVSVLTTYQHQFIDVPTGAALGWFSVWLWPDGGGSPLRGAALTPDRRRRRLAVRYALSGVVLGSVGMMVGGMALWVLWPAGSPGP